MLEVTLYYAAEADPIEQTFLQNKNNVYHCHSHIISYRFDSQPKTINTYVLHSHHTFSKSILGWHKRKTCMDMYYSKLAAIDRYHNTLSVCSMHACIINSLLQV